MILSSASLLASWNWNTDIPHCRGERGTRVEKRRTVEDGFIWRKYGQKEIHGSKYPRCGSV